MHHALYANLVLMGQVVNMYNTPQKLDQKIVVNKIE